MNHDSVLMSNDPSSWTTRHNQDERTYIHDKTGRIVAQFFGPHADANADLVCKALARPTEPAVRALIDLCESAFESLDKGDMDSVRQRIEDAHYIVIPALSPENAGATTTACCERCATCKISEPCCFACTDCEVCP